jgi:hypothetical protein
MADMVREEHVSSAIRYIACETYAIGMVGLWLLAAIEHERDEKGELWISKVRKSSSKRETENCRLTRQNLQWARLTPRLLAGIVAIFLPLTHQQAESSDSEISIQEENDGTDITTTKLLAILAGMSFLALLWEQVACLDGPNAPFESAKDDLLSRADDGHTSKAALSTPPWRGKYTYCTTSAHVTGADESLCLSSFALPQAFQR